MGGINMAKSNIRSMRFSDAILEMIEQQAGETFTAKFEALVTKCSWELPKKEKDLKEIQRRIEKEREQLRYIMDRKSRLENQMRNLEYSQNNLISQINRIIKELEEL